MTNVDKLKGAIKEKRLTPEKVAESIGIDKSTMYRKPVSYTHLTLPTNREV